MNQWIDVLLDNLNRLYAENEELQNNILKWIDANNKATWLINEQNAEIAKLRLALQEIIEDSEFIPHWDIGRLMDVSIARRALGESEE